MYSSNDDCYNNENNVLWARILTAVKINIMVVWEARETRVGVEVGWTSVALRSTVSSGSGYDDWEYDHKYYYLYHEY